MSQPQNNLPINPQSILENLIASGVIWLFSKVYTGLGYGPQAGSKELDPLLKQAIEDEAYNFEWDGPSRMEEVGLFLNSPEAEAIVRQIYATKLEQKDVGIVNIREQFLALLAYHLEVEKQMIEEQASALFNSILKRCEQVLQAAIDKGILAAHEALSSQRHQMLLDQIENINKNLEFLKAKKRISKQRILKFEEKYREHVAQRHAYIEPPIFNSDKRRIPIDDLYVAPHFLSYITPAEKRFTLDKFTPQIYRTVLLGNPGGGKSTFSKKICHDLSTDQRGLDGHNLTPILIVLRDYGVLKKQRNCSILEYIEIKSNEDYQLKPPAGAFEYLLFNGRVVVIFDGLDELLDTGYRQDITRNVELFCNLYPSVPILVTSREIGYDQAPLDEKKFETFRLAPFKDNQVQEYARKWFNSDSDLSPKQRQETIDAFLEELKVVPDDLTSSPLLLALMCNMYYGKGSLPKRRTDIYERCSTMLFEKWDKDRGIKFDLKVDTHLRPTMMYLANWIYQDANLQGGVTERHLIKQAAKYLLEKQFEDEDEAEHAASEFIEFCKGRAWVFTNTGSTKTGQELFQFTHRTFLEYFTAAYLVRTQRTNQKLLDLLLPRIVNEEWDIVAQLAFQKRTLEDEYAADELLNTVIKESEKLGVRRKWNLLYFAARCLSFISPSPQIIRQIVSNCMSWSINKGVIHLKTLPLDEMIRDDSIEKLVGELFNSSKENIYVIIDEFKGELINFIISGDDYQSVIAYEIAYDTIHQIIDTKSVNDYLVLRKSIIDATSTHVINNLCPKHFYPCRHFVYQGNINIIEFIKWHGAESLFRSYSYKTKTNSTLIPITSSILFRILWKKPGDDNNNLTKQVKQIGKTLSVIPTPWVKSSAPLVEHDNWVLNGKTISNEHAKWIDSDQEFLYGLFLIFGALLEASSDAIQNLNKFFLNHGEYLAQYLDKSFRARFEVVSATEIEQEFNKCGFTPEQREFIWKWIRREINFVGNAEEN